MAYRKLQSYLMRNKIAWQWGEKEEQSFLVLKVVMAIVPIFCLPDFEWQFVVMTNASGMAVGAILE